MKSFLALAAAAGLSTLAVLHAAGQPHTAAAVTIDQLIDIRHPSAPMWSPDGRHVVFSWERAGVANVYVAERVGGGTPRELAAAGNQLANAFWSADGRALMIPKNGDLWRVPIDGSGAAAPVWTTPQVESSITPSPDRLNVAYVRDSEIFVRSLTGGHETSVLKHNANVGGLSWSPDGRSLLFTSGAHTIVHQQTPQYSGSKIIYTITENVPGRTM